MLLTPQPLTLRLQTLIHQFPLVYHLMPHILHPTTRCSIILWPSPPILLMFLTSMPTYKPVNLSSIHSSQHIQTHILPQVLHPLPLLPRVLGVNLILNSIRHSPPPISYHPLHNSNIPNSHRTINNNNNNNLQYPRLLLTWSSIIIITKILIQLCNTIHFNNKFLLLLLNNNNSNSNFSHNSSNNQLLLEPLPLFQPPLIAVIHMLLMNPTDSP